MKMETKTFSVTPVTTLLMNTTSSDQLDDHIAATQQILLVVIFLVAFIFICGGNLLTILTVWRTPSLRTVSNMYVVSLAVVDFLTGAIIPYYCLPFFPRLDDYLNSNKYLCLFRFVLFHICVAESIACMVVIAFDRFLLIRYPLHYSTLTSPFKAGVAIFITWIASCFLGCVPLWEHNWEEDGRCDSFTVLTPTFRLYGLIPSFFVCCLVTAICYGYIVKRARRHQREALERRKCQMPFATGPLLTSQNDWKSVKVFLLVYGVFFVCWCPNFILVALGYVMHIPRTMIYFTVVLGFLNSGMNFLIYAWQYQQFRDAFRKFLCGDTRQPSPVSNQRVPTTPLP